MQIAVVTGLSGAGKSTVLNALEDLGFYCVDNLPLPLIPKFLELLRVASETDKVGLGIDVRAGEFLAEARAMIPELRRGGHRVEVLFLEAPEDVLVRRFSQTRRRHPLAGELREGIQRERELVADLRDLADKIIDTGNLNVHDLKDIVKARYGRQLQALTMAILSFGFKFGVPAEADMVLDVRFLPNPYFIESLSAHSGLDDGVMQFVLGSKDAQEYLDRVESLMDFTLPRFEREGKAYLTVAIGCTGGRHRSVVLAEELGRRLRRRVPCVVRHRDVERGTP